MDRTFWRTAAPLVDDSSDDEVVDITRTQVDDPEKANLISSYVGEPNDLMRTVMNVEKDTALHKPTLDIDLPCQLIESTTPNHHHLFIDHLLTWEDYKKLLKVLEEVGIIETGFYENSIRRGATFVRRPGVTKENEHELFDNIAF